MIISFAQLLWHSELIASKHQKTKEMASLQRKPYLKSNFILDNQTFLMQLFLNEMMVEMLMMCLIGHTT